MKNMTRQSASLRYGTNMQIEYAGKYNGRHFNVVVASKRKR